MKLQHSYFNKPSIALKSKFNAIYRKEKSPEMGLFLPAASMQGAPESSSMIMEIVAVRSRIEGVLFIYFE